MTADKETSNRFRQRARECRAMAEEVQESDWRKTLLDLAQDLEDEAEQMEAEASTG